MLTFASLNPILALTSDHRSSGPCHKALAERMDCTQQYVSKILKGKENMSLDTLSKLEDALGISLIYDEEVVSPCMVAKEVFA